MKAIHSMYFLAAALFVVTGCTTTYTVHSDYDPNVDFSRLKTFDWTSSSQPETGDPGIDSPLLNSQIRNAIHKTLASKGYRHLTKGSADFLVQYHVAIEERSDVMTIDTPSYAAGPTATPGGFSTIGSSVGYQRTQTYVVRYEEGTLVIDIVDPKSKQIIWRGSVQKVIERSASPEKKNTRIEKAVQKTLKTFPPQ